MLESINHRRDRTRPRMIADALWDHRHTLRIVREEKGDRIWVRVTITDALDVLFTEYRDGSYLTQLTTTASGHPSTLHRQFSTDPEGFVLIADAWRAAQASRMLRTMGEPDGIPGDRIEPRSFRPWDVFIDRRNDRLPAYDLLMKRLDAAVATILADFPPDQDASHIDVGNGLMAVRCYDDGLLVHKDHGATTSYGPGRHFPLMADAFALLRRRSVEIAVTAKPAIPAPVLPALGNARATRMLQLCGEAIARDPMLTDASGALIAPLLTKHVPELVRVHRESSKHALPQELERIDEDFAEGMDIVCGAVEQALKATRDASRDELRTQLAFLRSRHPDAAPHALGVAA